MNVFEKVIYIAGVARSGTSWIGQVFNSSPRVRFRFQPLFSYEFKNWVDENSTKEEYEHLFKEMFKSEAPFLLQKDKQESGEYPCFKKNARQKFLVFKENSYQSFIEPMLRRVPYLQLVGVVRHPCAVLNSWQKNEKEFPPGSDIMQEWRFGSCKNQGNEDYFGYYKWKEVANLYLDLQDKYPERIFILRYEDAVDYPAAVFKKLFYFLDIPFENQTKDFIQTSTNQHKESYYAVYKNKSVKDRWRSELAPYIISEIMAELKGTRLEQFIR